jgi:lysophospholipase L1-like esterase
VAGSFLQTFLPLYDLVGMNLFEEEVKQLEQKVSKHPKQRVVFYGSSTIRLWKNLEADFPHVDPLNLGFGGSTLAACGWYFERLIVPAQPRALVLYAGDNDLGENRQPQEVYLFFCALASKMQQSFPDVPFWFISIKPSPARWQIINEIRATNKAIASEISRIPNATFIDLSSAMLTNDGKPRHELYEADGLHLNPTGYEVWHNELIQRCSVLADK